VIFGSVAYQFTASGKEDEIIGCSESLSRCREDDQRVICLLGRYTKRKHIGTPSSNRVSLMLAKG
jgi:hypothetical protein